MELISFMNTVHYFPLVVSLPTSEQTFNYIIQADI